MTCGLCTPGHVRCQLYRVSTRYGGAVPCKQGCVRIRRDIWNLILSTNEGRGEVDSHVLTVLPRIPTKQQHSTLTGVDQGVMQRSQPAVGTVL